MKNTTRFRHWPDDEDTFWLDQFFKVPSLPREFENEGDEFLDDAIRTFDQDFQQMDGTLELSRIRAARIAKI